METTRRPGVKIPIQQPLLRTEAEQLQINQKRLEAELYRMQMIASQESQKQKLAEFVGAPMQREEQRQPHVTYNIYSGGGGPPPPPPSPTPIPVDPMKQVEALERRLMEERQQSEQKLHEATAASKQTVNQKMLEIQGDVKKGY